ncbi:hypothetical protein CLAFUW4_08260 [Fulvia fulva]|uniref:Uncharacterized protein n=1 Tax=Passalora fulva TaxID=5499 RepID=A0A9Q8LEV1_PASFU|nr:uncharacterized protein CLAFUR5_08369 [Fulvia fulva]KAK4628801.1 hypothetical protein CLAFUR4_08265 [Fulvia fulva]KAK4630746.1 hypothetical protein CLAFUR0_08260 [Fulvia fulva]UJO15398.1 hypothetical protein CLAFUR5_08369 [Fulvia fulva]WPV12274.1 hypothetical protein CLAFUW4_08260 [Fulvia fulva]WPV27240.1 hypothetical protein CLAFUW7_08260 [Fulvia fulva]
MAARLLAHTLLKRQSGDQTLGGTGVYDDVDADTFSNNDEYDDHNSWWWSPTGMAVRYTVIVLLFGGIILFFLGGYYHAQRRIRKGLPPKPYHAWMVRRAYRRSPQYNPYYQQQQPYHYQPQEGYPMQSYPQASGAYGAAPPPAYYPHTAPPPAYQPPEGASKAMADQNIGRAGVYRAAEGGQASRLDQPLPPPGQMGPLPPVPSTAHQ